MSSNRATCLSKKGMSLRHVIIALTFMTWSGCAYAPNLVPYNTPDDMDIHIIRSVAGALSYPVVQSVDDPQAVIDGGIKVRWKKRGAWVPWQVPFATAAEWRFVLTAPGVVDPLCLTPWKDADSENTTEVFCKFDVPHYYNKAVIGEVDYRFSKATESKEAPDYTKEEPHSTHERIYFFIPKPPLSK